MTRCFDVQTDRSAVGLRRLDLVHVTAAHGHIVVVVLRASDGLVQVVIANGGRFPDLLGFVDGLGRYLLSANAPDRRAEDSQESE